MKVIKILNNNALLALDNDGFEYVYLAKGIGFQNKINEELIDLENQKQYKLFTPEVDNGRNPKDIIERVEAIYIEISAYILSLTQQKFKNVDEDILLPLADHIAFAIQRIKNGVSIINPFVNDIKLLFTDEYEVAEQSKDFIKEKTNVTINEDEISYITLHINSAIRAEHIDLSMQIIRIIKNFINEIEQECGIEVNYNSITYTRFITHIRFMVARIYNDEYLGVDMNNYTETNFPYSYKKAVELAEIIGSVLKNNIKDIEIGYLALHIERVVQSTVKQEID